MVSVSSVNSVNVNPNFKSKRVTKEGNIYDKTNVGKIAGSAVGAAYGGVQVYAASKFLSENRGILYDLAETMAKYFEGIDKGIVDDVVRVSEETTAEFLKGVNIGKGILAAAVVLGTALVGLGVGAIADYGINKYKAHKADKNANAVDKAEPIKTDEEKTSEGNEVKQA